MRAGWGEKGQHSKSKPALARERKRKGVKERKKDRRAIVSVSCCFHVFTGTRYEGPLTTRTHPTAASPGTHAACLFGLSHATTYNGPLAGPLTLWRGARTPVKGQKKGVGEGRGFLSEFSEDSIVRLQCHVVRGRAYRGGGSAFGEEKAAHLVA